MSLWVVVGGQYGSEGKGRVSAFITRQENIDLCVRCGGPNSGHSFVDQRGETVVLRQVPTGFINPRARLLIPAGALVDPEILKKEIDFLSLSAPRLGIDEKCFIITEADREEEQRLGLHERLSSTLCGVGAAQARRVLRGEDARLARDVVDELPWLGQYLTDVSDEVNSVLDDNGKVLIEGTQGFGLSVYHSEHYPKATSRDTTAAGFLSEVGVSPLLVTEIVVVFRTFPIRVAGQQAGPMSAEISWRDVERESKYPDPVAEYTTVTKRLRRVSHFDWDLARRCVVSNRPTKVAITGLDYLSFSNRGVTQWSELDKQARDFVDRLEAETRAPIGYCGTGPALHEMFSLSIRGNAIESEQVTRAI
jgi:adenylosuccinate synthase